MFHGFQRILLQAGSERKKYQKFLMGRLGGVSR
jgi:hypothetical protein